MGVLPNRFGRSTELPMLSLAREGDLIPSLGGRALVAIFQCLVLELATESSSLAALMVATVFKELIQ